MKSTLIELEEQIMNHINSGKRLIVWGIGRYAKVGDRYRPETGELTKLCQKHPARIVAVCTLDEYIEYRPVSSTPEYVESIRRDIELARSLDIPIGFYEIHFD